MERFECNFPALRVSAIVLVLTAAVAAALIWTSNAYLSRQALQRQQARGELSGVRERYRQALEAQDIIRTSRARYERLRQRGFVGDEPRLIWIEALRNSGRRQHLYSLQYDLRQRQPLQLDDLQDNSHYQVYGSFMHLDMELAHEVDLLRYFQDLEAQHPAVWQLRGCSLSSMALEDRVALDKPNVKARCDLAWYTVRAFGTEEGNSQP